MLHGWDPASRPRDPFRYTSDRLLRRSAKEVFEHAEHAQGARIAHSIMQGLGLAAEADEAVAAKSRPDAATGLTGFCRDVSIFL